MPLFKAKVARIVEEEIPVHARSLEVARRYLETDDEWKQGDSSLTLLNVEQVTHPYGLIGWEDPDFLCWGESECQGAVEAFYDFWSFEWGGITEEQANDMHRNDEIVMEKLREEFRKMTLTKPAGR